jgi:hypothetical protein
MTVVFVAPYFLETTLRFVAAVARRPDVRLGLISRDPLEKMPEEIRGRLAAHYRVEKPVDTAQLLRGVEGIQERLGPVERLLGTLEELQVPLGEIRDRLGIEGMGGETARNFRDKARMKEVLRSAGLPCARSALARSVPEAEEQVRAIGLPVVLKPPAGAGARGTARIETAPQLAAWLRGVPPSPEQPTLIEEFITGDEHSFDSIFVNGNMVWFSINHYFPSALHVVENPWIQWCVLLPREADHPRYADIRETAEASLRALGMRTGLSHLEWFRRRDGSVVISEVGARPPGAHFTSLISYAHDFDLYRAWGELMVDGRFEPRERPYAAGAAYLRGQGTGRVVAVHRWEEARRALGALVVEARLPRPGQPPSTSYEGDGTVILRHPETRRVEEGLRYLISTVRVERGESS